MGQIPFVTGVPDTNNIDVYRDAKLNILEEDFHIYITDEERKHANNLKTEIAIDNFFISAISNQRWY